MAISRPVKVLGGGETQSLEKVVEICYIFHLRLVLNNEYASKRKSLNI